MIDVSAAIRIMFMYSARKNSANVTPEYSTWKPATISDSPSATSNGWRLVSAMPEIEVDDEQREQRPDVPVAPAPPSWPRTMSDRFRLYAAISTPTSAKPIAIS